MANDAGGTTMHPDYYRIFRNHLLYVNLLTLMNTQENSYSFFLLLGNGNLACYFGCGR